MEEETQEDHVGRFAKFKSRTRVDKRFTSELETSSARYLEIINSATVN